MKKILDSALRKQLKKVFSQKKDILAVYIFGSRASGLTVASSDLDLAVFLNDRKKISEREIIKFLKEAGVEIPFNLDLVCVDFDSSPLFLYQIIKNGFCLYQRQSFSKTNLEALILKLYYDNQHLRNIYRQYRQQSFQEGTYGY